MMRFLGLDEVESIDAKLNQQRVDNKKTQPRDPTTERRQ